MLIVHIAFNVAVLIEQVYYLAEIKAHYYGIR
jgi:hypothetical protein